jgi:hypothetical protein
MEARDVAVWMLEWGMVLLIGWVEFMAIGVGVLVMIMAEKEAQKLLNKKE